MERPDWENKVLEDLDRLQLPCWDGASAKPIEYQVIVQAMRIVQAMAELVPDCKPDILGVPIEGHVRLIYRSGFDTSDGELSGLDVDVGENGIKYIEFNNESGVRANYALCQGLALLVRG